MQKGSDVMDLLILHIVGLGDSLFCNAAGVGGARLKRNGQRLWVSAKLFLVVADLAGRERQLIYDNSKVGFFSYGAALKSVQLLMIHPSCFSLVE